MPVTSVRRVTISPVSRLLYEFATVGFENEAEFMTDHLCGLDVPSECKVMYPNRWRIIVLYVPSLNCTPPVVLKSIPCGDDVYPVASMTDTICPGIVVVDR
jgi:hypothetical protein